MSHSIHFLNGKYVTEEELRISPRDLGFNRGYAVFDFLITYPHHRPFKLNRHIDRLFHSAELVGLLLPWTREQIKEWIIATLGKNTSPTEKAIKIILSGGISNTLLPSNKPTLIILVDPFHAFDQELYAKGAHLATVNHTRYTPGAKTNNYIEAVKQVQLGKTSGILEPLYYSDKQVFECATANVFIYKGHKLITPKNNILLGITRDVVLHDLKLSVPCVVEDFTLNDLFVAKEVFITGSNKEIMPVTIVDEKKIGDGSVGSVTHEVMQAFRTYTCSNMWS